MRNFRFIFFCVFWLADVAAMVVIAPLGEHVVVRVVRKKKKEKEEKGTTKKG